MTSNSNKKGILYDIVGVIIFLLIIFGCVMCCSSKARNYTISTIENLYNNQAIKNDSIPLVKDTITPSPIVTKTDTVYIKEKDNTVRDTIPLVKGNDNLYYLTAEINGIPMRFALDTGCSDIYISIVEYLFLERQGLIKSKKVLPCQSIIANGDTIHDYGTIILDNVTIGNRTVKNVNCSVSNNQESSLLLGQGVLSKMGDITIKYNQNMLIFE